MIFARSKGLFRLDCIVPSPSRRPGDLIPIGDRGFRGDPDFCARLTTAFLVFVALDFGVEGLSRAEFVREFDWDFSDSDVWLYRRVLMGILEFEFRLFEVEASPAKDSRGGVAVLTCMANGLRSIFRLFALKSLFALLCI